MRTEHILVGFDGSTPASTALQWALSEAERRGVAVRVIWVWGGGPPWDERVRVGAVLSSVVARHPDVSVRYDDRTGAAGPALVRASEEADLLVVGKHGTGAIAALMGSTTAYCLRHARCPVVVVPGVVAAVGSPASTAGAPHRST
ncbi:universal stress protein [Actinokineospora auranticolor]|uniref:Nucleotide-binding universal stress UspA family protein n=1 Tax=Actinokineospora auranticolor TaxID=155976 RepID=A0A2S6GIV8_9PSEU|nr:universal stress protein [Actinokineospora auranticolor]PPK65155.1 nucleotide-binding universal stress UspA family protein [Actinokineospora auranticolor]